MNSNTSAVIVKATLLLLAITQLVLSVVLYYNLNFFSATPFGPPFRLLSAIGVQALIFYFVGSVAKWSIRQKLLSLVDLVVLCGVSLHFLYKSYVSGVNVDVQGIRIRIEGGMLAVILIGFSILNLLMALRLPKEANKPGNLNEAEHT